MIALVAPVVLLVTARRRLRPARYFVAPAADQARAALGLPLDAPIAIELDLVGEARPARRRRQLQAAASARVHY